MKANELMLNDWIYSPGKEECGQVRELSQGSVKIYVPQSKDGEACIIDGDPAYFWGIPLTKEIILLNADRFSLKHKDAPIPFGFGNDKFFCVYGRNYKFKVKYIHEVQNFLRVIGFTEEADTFEIN